MAKQIAKVQKVGWNAIKAGGASGIAIGLLSGMIGPLPAHLIGGIGVGALLGGVEGTVVSVNAVQDAVVVALTATQA